jgi:hypothetical protein
MNFAPCKCKRLLLLFSRAAPGGVGQTVRLEWQQQRRRIVHKRLVQPALEPVQHVQHLGAAVTRVITCVCTQQAAPCPQLAPRRRSPAAPPCARREAAVGCRRPDTAAPEPHPRCCPSRPACFPRNHSSQGRSCGARVTARRTAAAAREGAGEHGFHDYEAVGSVFKRHFPLGLRPDQLHVPARRRGHESRAVKREKAGGKRSRCGLQSLRLSDRRALVASGGFRLRHKVKEQGDERTQVFAWLEVEGFT